MMVCLSEMVVSSAVLLCVVFLQGAQGTFPPTVNPPPVPAQNVRGLDNSPQGFYVRENLPKDIPQPLVKEDGLFQFDTKLDDQRWYFQENQPGETQSSAEDFDQNYQSGEPAIGPVATPIPDDAYLAQPSTLTKLNPGDLENLGGSDIWIVTRGSERQYVPDRWVQVQVPEERYVDVNQDSGTAVATDTVSSFVAPAVSDLPSNQQANILQQIWVRAPNVVGPQKVISNTPTFVENVPTVKQVVDAPPPSGKQFIQQQIFTDVYPAPIPPPVSPQTVSKKSFTAPPPLPPPLKGKGAPPSIISSGPVNVIPDSNFVISSKNVIPDSNVVVNDKNVVQQLRHVWIPTSARTGKFITIPVSPVNTGKSVSDKGLSLANTPVTVSDTWVLRQNGPIPTFEKQKSSLPPPIVQSGKVIVQNTPVVQLDLPPNPPTVVQVNSPKSPPVIGKGVIPNSPVDIWPLKGDLNSKSLSKSPSFISKETPVPSGKSDATIAAKAFPLPPVFAQKTILNSKAPVPVPVPPPAVPLNGKPCPLPIPAPQKSLITPKNPTLLAAPKIVSTPVQRFPFARIIRVNRFPTGSYYLLNRNVRPNLFAYSNPTVVQQPKTGLIRLVQNRPVAVQLTKQQIPSLQTKQITLPVQQRQIFSSVPAKQIQFPFPTRQIILPSSKSSPSFYPQQAIRYAYPLNAFLKSSPVPGKGVLVPQFSSLKLANSGSNSKSSSSDSSSSSSESSSESSEEEKKGKTEKAKTEEKPKKEKLESEEKSKTEEENKSGERERESESVSKSEEPADEPESAGESKSEESMEAAESLLSLSQVNMDGLGPVGKPYVVRFDSRDKNGTLQYRQEVSDEDRRVTDTDSFY